MIYMQSVGLRELNQRAGAVVRRVAATGEGVDVTDRGRVVARIVPAQPASVLERLIADGLATAASGDLLGVEPVQLPPGSRPLSAILEEMRADERY